MRGDAAVDAVGEGAPDGPADDVPWALPGTPWAMPIGERQEMAGSPAAGTTMIRSYGDARSNVTGTRHRAGSSDAAHGADVRDQRVDRDQPADAEPPSRDPRTPTTRATFGRASRAARARAKRGDAPPETEPAPQPRSTSPPPPASTLPSPATPSPASAAEAASPPPASAARPAFPPRARKRAGQRQQADKAAAAPEPRRAASRADADADRDDAIRRAFGGFRQVTVVNPGQGTGRSTATSLLAAAFAQVRGVGVVAWDAGPGDPGGRPAALAAALATGTPPARGQLAAYLDSGGGVDLLGAGAAGSDADFGAVRDTLARFYQLAIVDSGNDLLGEAWHRVVEASDQLVVTIAAAGSSGGSAAVRLLDRLENDGRRRLARQAVTVVTAVPGRFDVGRRDADLVAIQRHFAGRTRAVHVVPHDRALGGGPVRFEATAATTRAAWLRIAADVAAGL